MPEEDLWSKLKKIVSKFKSQSNITPPEWKPPAWDAEHIQSSIEALRLYAEQSATVRQRLVLPG